MNVLSDNDLWLWKSVKVFAPNLDVRSFIRTQIHSQKATKNTYAILGEFNDAFQLPMSYGTEM